MGFIKDSFNDIKFSLFLLLVVMLLGLLGFYLQPKPTIIYAHSGRTDSSGGHNCYTGPCAGTYHYHNGGYNYNPPPQVYCGRNASLGSDNNCWCNAGYTVGVDGFNCVYLPPNAHSVKSLTDAWQCNVGYKEIGNRCVKDFVPITPIPVKTTPSAVREVENSGEDISWVLFPLLVVGGGMAYLIKKVQSNS